jgi:hypothetical protein
MKLAIEKKAVREGAAGCTLAIVTGSPFFFFSVAYCPFCGKEVKEEPEGEPEEIPLEYYI